MTRPFSLPAVNYYGKAAVNNLLGELKKSGFKKAFVVSDHVLKEAGIVDRVLDHICDDVDIEEFLDVEREPSVENVEKAIDKFKASSCDVIIGIGGGSPLDVSKAVSIMATNEGSILDYVGIELVPKPGVPKFLIPTTAGTGSEITKNVIVTDKKDKLKKGIVSHHLIPDVAIVDSDLTLSVPAEITAATGMDALTHAIESYTAQNATMQTDLYALKAIELVAENLRTAVFQGNDENAREGMAMASVFAGISLANAGVGAVHALAYPLGGRYGVSHGVANATLLPYVMDFNCTGNIEKFKQIAIAMGGNTDGLSKRDAALMAAEEVRKLSIDVGIPQSLDEFGVKKEEIPSIAEGAMKAGRLISNNPRQITIEDVKAIFSKMI